MTPDPAPLLVEDAGSGVLLLRLNRPERFNALATPLLLEIAAALTKADTDPAIRAAVVTGSATLFAAGADINELADARPTDPIETPRFVAWAEIRAFSKPLVAAVEGLCLGAGAELMMRCDLVIAGAEARFGQPESNLGFIPGAGGTALLPRRVGVPLAMEMVMTGKPIDADRAFQAGLINRVVESGTALDAALELATTLAARAPETMRAAKLSVRRAMEMPLDAHLLAERELFVMLVAGDEAKEGIAAFREKRKPDFLKPRGQA